MLPADPRILGATLTDGGCNFAIWSNAADAVELCLFNEINGKLVETRFALSHRNGPIWHGYLAGVRAGQRYGYRIYGPWIPEQGARFNAAKLLIDPYTHKLSGELHCVPEIYGHVSLDGLGTGDSNIRDDRDSSEFVPLSVVVPSHPREVTRPFYPWAQEVIYEAHVQGLTAKNQDIPLEERGTYKALGHSSTIEYLKNLGITALELLPIHAYLTEPAIHSRGRKNHWGYNAIAFSAPHAEYAATDDAISELQQSIDALHAAGIEVFLDVVFNHTAEGGVGGPSLSFKGIDNRAWYRGDGKGGYIDVTGCGNTVSASKPHAVRHIIDSLRWWVEVIGIDGFRFDLATALYPNNSASESSLLTAIESDSVLRNIKMIAEPWDISRYSLGDFPHPWREWNDRYRDSVRQFWLGDLARGFGEGVSDIASGISGSSDVFYHRGPTSSINFVTAHDGFTLADLTMYSEKKNYPNQEDNRDGSNDNRSWNMGVEGPTDDPLINSLRHSIRKSIFATLLLSAGVPMITMGDEVARTQCGSNNAYSLPLYHRPSDADTPENFLGGWALPWETNDMQKDIREAVSELIRIRKTYLADIATEFFTGRVDLGTKRKDIAWFSLNGNEMTEDRWEDGARRTLTVFIDAGPDQGLLLLLNSDRIESELTLPGIRWGTSYRRIFDASQTVRTHTPIIQVPSSKVKSSATLRSSLVSYSFVIPYIYFVLAIIAPGQGSQTPGMLAPWIEDSQSENLLKEWSDAIGLDLIHLGVNADADEIKDTSNAQPLIVAAGLLSGRALVAQVNFAYVAGHSVGEITAAALAGVLTPLDAMKLVRLRGVEMAKAAATTPSGMAAVLGGERDAVLKAIADLNLVAANDNGGGQIVAAGAVDALSRLTPEGSRVRPLAVAGAFHTSYMQSAVEPLRALASTIAVSDPHCGVLSNKDGAVVTNGTEIVDRIVNQIANPVRWDLCMEKLLSLGVTGAIEVAPAGTLVGLIKRAAPGIAQCALKSPADLDIAREFISQHGGNS